MSASARPPVDVIAEPVGIDLFGRTPTRKLWHLINSPRHVDGTAVRVASALLLVFYLVSVLMREAPGPAARWLRAAVCASALVGVLLGPRFTWTALRAYTVGMALLLPAVTAAIMVMRGSLAGDLGPTALAIFVPVAFLQTATDVIAASGVVALGIAGLLAAYPPIGVSVEAAAIVLAGSLASGVAVAVVLSAFRGRAAESTAWWKEAAARERTLREFTEVAARHLGEEVPADELAGRFRSAFGGGACALVLTDVDGGGPRLAATAGVPPDTAGRAEAEPEQLARLLAAVADRQPLVREALGPQDVERHAGAMPWVRAGGALVVLPVVLDASVAGAVVLSATAPRRVDADELLLWQAMAIQVGVAVGSARLVARLQAALRARSEFVDTMSHELRSPLHVIISYADMLADGGEDVAHIAARVRASALELLHLVEGTMAVGRLGTGKLGVQPSEFALRELIDEARESIAALPQARRAVPVRWEVDEGLPRARLDRLKLKEIVYNLVSNALKFTSEGSVRVRVGLEGERLRIDVEDTGIGIPPGAQERIFEMFERLEPAQGPGPAGAGLGLFIVRSLVALMDGTLALRSEPGRGSCFTVWLPLRMADVPAGAA